MTDSVGARLRQGRELRGLTLQQASESTKVRAYYLQALENDDYSAIPSAPQARGFLRIYAEFLELDPGSLVPPATPVVSSPMVDSSSAPETTASQAGRASLWDTLLGRFGRRANKESTPPSSPDQVVPVETGAQADQTATTTAAADAKTVRHRKGVAAGTSGPADVKKNAES